MFEEEITNTANKITNKIVNTVSDHDFSHFDESTYDQLFEKVCDHLKDLLRSMR